MGAYLSEPKTTKESMDTDGAQVRCGASSMQGWRISQEDAHNCLLEFDKDASLFAVYDGHGGHEVAEYCSKYLPDFIKKNENYAKGNFEEALKDAFLEFDATLATSSVIAELKALASGKDGKPSSDQEGGSDSESEEAIDNLVQEAHMPLEEVMAKYKVGGPLCRVLKAEGGKPPVSPMLRGRRSRTSAAAGGSGSQDGASSSAGSSSSAVGSSKSSKEDAEVSSSSSGYTNTPVLCNGDAHVNGEVGSGDSDEKTEAEAKVKNKDVKVEKSVECETIKSDSVKDCSEKVGRTEPDSSGISNGESNDVSSSSEKCVKEPEASEITSSTPPKKKRISSAAIYQKLLDNDSDSEEEDETFQADAECEDGSSDDEEGGDEAEGEGEEEEDSSEDDEEEEEEEEEEDDPEYPCMDVKEEPGSDSGCTAVVALLVGSELFVANAGDSRCVVSREGKAVEMSFDHKPEDELEKVRIETAGGKVTCDGRVNGGLNLSRAIGDHSYKQVKVLPPSRQMITALPDVQRLSVDPSKDQFMVLACDGIWNSLTSQEVVDFVSIKLQQNTQKLSQICEELFEHCLAPNTQGDGTGCDNMTCVIVQFKGATSTADKRPAEEPCDEPSSKRSRVDETPAS